MNNTVSLGIGFLIGTGVGVGIGVYATKKYFQKYADEEIYDIREYYENKLEDTLSSVQEDGELFNDFREVIDESEDVIPVTNMEEVEKHVERIDYNKISTPYRPDTENLDIFTITPDMFSDDLEFQKELFYYYELDDILVNESEGVEPPSTFEKCLFYKLKDSVGEFEDNMLYIRNRTEAVDYLIEFRYNRWSEEDEYLEEDYDEDSE